jgi:beta-lactamase superfamily II metal-dependent hydrolase
VGHNNQGGGIRKKQKKQGISRRKQKAFFLTTLLVLVFALVYNFFGLRQVPTALGENYIMVTFLDVGQGESILLRTNTHAVLIDGGDHRYRDVVLDYLRFADVRHIDYVIATHPHSDHIGGLVTVLGRVSVGQVVMPDVTHDTITFENFLAVIENREIPIRITQAGDRIQAGIIELLVLAPSGIHPRMNDMSVVVRLEHGQTSFLFTGDAESASERQMVSSGFNLSADVLNIGHHGSRTSTTENFLYAVSPTIAVISVGRNNPFGHPHSEVIERLESQNITILRTDELGTIRMITDGNELSTVLCAP